jgi:hypothetical protein
MRPPWIHSIAPGFEPETSAPRPMDWKAAQGWCNFILMHPEVLPDGLSESEARVRPEAPPGRMPGDAAEARPSWTVSNRSCHRSEYAGGGRRLRIKQFLYDWAPPAFDHPLLWRSHNRAFPVGRHLGWLGLDFRSRVAASVCLDRTTIEISTLEGTFSDEELQELCRGLMPAVPELRRQILETPFADLCYQSRHRETPVQVPVGYWRHHRESLPVETRAFRAADAPLHLPGMPICRRVPEGYLPDSVLVYGDQEDPAEVDYLFIHRDDRGCSLRLLASPKRPQGIAYPPRLDEQPCSNEVRTLRGRAVYHAFLDPHFGPHEAVWEHDGLVLMLLVKPMIWTDTDWFLGLMERFLVDPPK